MFPISKFKLQTPQFFHCEKFFTQDEMEQISYLEELQKFERGKIGTDSSENDKVRDSEVSWLNHDRMNHWLFEKYSDLVSRVNRDFFILDIEGFENFQYTVYKPGQHYNWHFDWEPVYQPYQRKISGVIMVSNPETDFEGGEFQIVTNGNPEEPMTVKMKQGDVLFFASWMPHRVKPVLSGKRKSLVGWVLGKNNG